MQPGSFHSDHEVDGRTGFDNSQNKSSADWSDSLRELLAPGAAGLSARLTSLGLKGELQLDINSMKRQLSKLDSPVAGELVNRITTMQADGWQFLEAAPEAHAGVYQLGKRRIFYQAQGSMLSHALGLDLNPIKQTLPIIAHETAHHNGVVFYQSGSLNSQERRVMDGRMLEAETTSMLTETHIADQLGVKDSRPWKVSTEPRRAAIKSGELGQYIVDTHSKFFKEPLEPQWVKTKVNSFIDTVYGGNIVDTASGKVRAFDLNASYGRNIAELRLDEAARQKFTNIDYVNERIRHPESDVRSKLGKALGVGENQAMSTGAHVVKGLAAVGLLMAVGDIAGGFEQSVGTGIKRMTKVGIDWSGYAAGTTAANAVMTGMGDIAVHCPRIGTAAVVLSGFAGAYLADVGIGRYLEDEPRIIPK
jgi:hypothetical protein